MSSELAKQRARKRVEVSEFFDNHYGENRLEAERIKQKPFDKENVEDILDLGKKFSNYSIALKEIQDSGSLRDYEKSYPKKVSNLSKAFDRNVNLILTHKGYPKFWKAYKEFDVEELEESRKELNQVATMCYRMGNVAFSNRLRGRKHHKVKRYLEFIDNASKITDDLEDIVKGYHRENIDSRGKVKTYIVKAKEFQKKISEVSSKFKPSGFERLFWGLFSDHAAFTYPEGEDTVNSFVEELESDMENYDEVIAEREELLEKKSTIEEVERDFDKHFPKDFDEDPNPQAYSSHIRKVKRLIGEDLEGRLYGDLREKAKVSRERIRTKYMSRRDETLGSLVNQFKEAYESVPAVPSEAEEMKDYVSEARKIRENVNTLSSKFDLLDDVSYLKKTKDLEERLDEKLDVYEEKLQSYSKLKISLKTLEDQDYSEIDVEAFAHLVSDQILGKLAEDYKEKATKLVRKGIENEDFYLSDYIQNSLPKPPNSEQFELMNTLNGAYDSSYPERFQRFLKNMKKLDSPQTLREVEYVRGLGTGIQRARDSGSFSRINDIDPLMNEIFTEINKYTGKFN